MKTSRRNFLLQLGGVALAAQAFPLRKAQANSSAEALTVRSGESRLVPQTHHYHFLSVPAEVIINPPAEGFVVSSSLDQEPNHPWLHTHFHKIRLTQAQLLTIKQGGSIAAEDSVGDHQWVISIANQIATN